MESLITQIRNKRRVAWIFLTVILASYATPLVQELDDVEPFADYYYGVLLNYITCNPTQLDKINIHQNAFLRYWFNCFSEKVLGNDRVVPFAFSIGLVYLVYLLGHYITKDRIIGLISSTAFSINPLLTMYDTSPTYDQIWAFFVILSVVLLYKKPFLTPLVYPLAIASKILAISYLPVFVYTILSEPIKHKKLTLGLLVLVITIGIITVMALGPEYKLGFHPERLGVAVLQLLIHLTVLLPILGIFALFLVMFKAKTKIIGTRIVYVWMIWILLTTLMIFVFSGHMQYSYRYVPFAAFMSVFIGISIVNFGNKVVEMLPRSKTHESEGLAVE